MGTEALSIGQGDKEFFQESSQLVWTHFFLKNIYLFIYLAVLGLVLAHEVQSTQAR